MVQKIKSNLKSQMEIFINLNLFMMIKKILLLQLEMKIQINMILNIKI